jgi:hypothetical protein
MSLKRCVLGYSGTGKRADPNSLMRTLVILCTFVVANPAFAGLFEHEVKPEDMNGIQRMAVHVRLGDTFHANFVGTTVFSNKFFDVPVPQWGIDSYITGQIVEAMSLRGRFPAQTLDLSRLNMQDLYHRPGAILGSREVEAALLEQAKQQGADALMVVEMSRPGENFRFQSPGYGAFRKDTFGVAMGCIYSSFNTVIFSVSTGKRLAWGGEAPCQASPHKPERQDAWEKYPPEQQAEFEAAVKDELRQKVLLRMEEYKLFKDSKP